MESGVLRPARLDLLLRERKGRQAGAGIQARSGGAFPRALDHAAHARLPGLSRWSTAGHEVVRAGELKRPAAPVLRGLNGDPFAHTSSQCD